MVMSELYQNQNQNQKEDSIQLSKVAEYHLSHKLLRVSLSSKLHSVNRLIAFCMPDTICTKTDKVVAECFLDVTSGRFGWY